MGFESLFFVSGSNVVHELTILPIITVTDYTEKMIKYINTILE
jgi:hypothetical protein